MLEIFIRIGIVMIADKILKYPGNAIIWMEKISSEKSMKLNFQLNINHLKKNQKDFEEPK